MTSRAPSASNDLTLASRLSLRSMGASTNAVTPTGTFTKKIQDQLSASVRIPPSRTPAAAPKPPTAPHTPSAMFRSRPSVNVVERIESAAGVMTAAPRPCNARAEINEASDHARPAKSEASVKRMSPARKIRLRPSRSAARPPRSRKPPKTSAYALMTHCRFCCENPRSTWIEGNATFTIAMSRTTMNWTTLSSASASHLRRSEVTMSSTLCLGVRSSLSGCRWAARLGKGLTPPIVVRLTAPHRRLRRPARAAGRATSVTVSARLHHRFGSDPTRWRFRTGKVCRMCNFASHVRLAARPPSRSRHTHVTVSGLTPPGGGFGRGKCVECVTSRRRPGSQFRRGAALRRSGVPAQPPALRL